MCTVCSACLSRFGFAAWLSRLVSSGSHAAPTLCLATEELSQTDRRHCRASAAVLRQVASQPTSQVVAACFKVHPRLNSFSAYFPSASDAALSPFASSDPPFWDPALHFPAFSAAKVGQLYPSRLASAGSHPLMVDRLSNSSVTLTSDSKGDSAKKKSRSRLTGHALWT